MDEPVVDAEQADSEPQRRGGPWNLILLVVVATILGILLVPGEEPAPVPVPVPVPISLAPEPAAGPPAADQAVTAEPQHVPAQADTLVPDPVSAPTADAEVEVEVDEPVAPVDASPGTSARELIARMRATGQGSLDDLYLAARKAQAAGGLSDAYLLYFFAAREGHAPSALVLAEQSDPAHFVPGHSLFDTPDLAQAHKWYRAAADSGDTEGRKKLEALRARIERMAADGNPEAQRIALQWQ